MAIVSLSIEISLILNRPQLTSHQFSWFHSKGPDKVSDHGGTCSTLNRVRHTAAGVPDGVKKYSLSAVLLGLQVQRLAKQTAVLSS